MTARPTPILMYHSVSACTPKRFSAFAVTPGRLREHLQVIKDLGFECLTASDFIAARDQGRLHENVVVLTFDDGFADFYYEAAPILDRYKATATLYAVAGLLGGTSRWLADIGAGDLPLLNSRQLVEISTAGIEIGAHGLTHVGLDCISLSQACCEIAVSKDVLEQALSLEIRSFAYPYGYYSRAVRNLLPQCGYTSGCAVGYAHSPADDDPFALRRHIVRANMTGSDLRAILQGASPLRAFAFDRPRSLVWKLVRHRTHGAAR